MNEYILEYIARFFIEKDKFVGIEENKFIKVNFIEDKVLDSIEFITLISELEENFSFIFTQEDLQSPLFETIEGMVDIINARITMQAP